MDSIGKDYVYLDYAAASPLCEEALRAMHPYMVAGREAISAGANANSLSAPGRLAFRKLEEARREVAEAIGAKRPNEVMFTSGATESDNAAIRGMAYAARDVRLKGRKDAKPQVVTSQIEHDAVLNAARQLEREGFDVVYLAPNRDGFIEARQLEAHISDSCVLVSVQMANSEVGSIQPVRQLAAIAHDHGALFHSDATQALGKVAVSVSELGVDAASFSSHKIGGPTGVGALYLQAKAPFSAFMRGGGQESGKRSGTQNVAGIVGFAAACEHASKNVEDEATRLRLLRDKLYRDLSSFDRIQPTVDVVEGSLDYLPNIVNVMIDGIESETAVIRFDSLGFAVSGGSACASRSLEASHVLTSMGISSDEAHGELRVTLGRYTTREDVNAFLNAVPKVLDWKY